MTVHQRNKNIESTPKMENETNGFLKRANVSISTTTSIGMSHYTCQSDVDKVTPEEALMRGMECILSSLHRLGMGDEVKRRMTERMLALDKQAAENRIMGSAV